VDKTQSPSQIQQYPDSQHGRVVDVVKPGSTEEEVAALELELPLAVGVALPPDFRDCLLAYDLNSFRGALHDRDSHGASPDP
jgi:hypothetical protein